MARSNYCAGPSPSFLQTFSLPSSSLLSVFRDSVIRYWYFRFIHSRLFFLFSLSVSSRLAAPRFDGFHSLPLFAIATSTKTYWARITYHQFAPEDQFWIAFCAKDKRSRKKRVQTTKQATGLQQFGCNRHLLDIHLVHLRLMHMRHHRAARRR